MYEKFKWFRSLVAAQTTYFSVVETLLPSCNCLMDGQKALESLDFSFVSIVCHVDQEELCRSLVGWSMVEFLWILFQELDLKERFSLYNTRVLQDADACCEDEGFSGFRWFADMISKCGLQIFLVRNSCSQLNCLTLCHFLKFQGKCNFNCTGLRKGPLHLQISEETSCAHSSTSLPLLTQCPFGTFSFQRIFALPKYFFH